MGLVLDSGIFIKAEHADNPLDFNKWQKYESVCISAITVSELLVGVHRAVDSAQQLKRSAFVEAILAKIPALSFDEEVARIHAELYSFLSKKGKLIGAHDLIIAATALSHGCALLTENIIEFKKVPGLEVLSDNSK